MASIKKKATCGTRTTPTLDITGNKKIKRWMEQTVTYQNTRIRTKKMETNSAIQAKTAHIHKIQGNTKSRRILKKWRYDR